jgi:hypothetical protein
MRQGRFSSWQGTTRAADRRGLGGVTTGDWRIGRRRCSRRSGGSIAGPGLPIDALVGSSAGRIAAVNLKARKRWENPLIRAEGVSAARYRQQSPSASARIAGGSTR